MAEMDVEDFLSPVVTAVRSHFLTWKAAARHGAGVILVFGGEGDPIRGYSIGGLQTAFARAGGDAPAVLDREPPASAW